MNKIIFLSILTTIILVGCEDKIERSEMDMINKVSKIDKQIETKMEALIEVCANGNVVQYKGDVSPKELADEILSFRKQKSEFTEILDKNIIVKKEYFRKSNKLK